MDALVLSTIESMATTTINFVGDVVSNLWGLFLSIALLAFAGRWILRKLGY